MKNTMGYGLNALLDFDDPVRILEHLIIGSEGTLAFVAEARFRTIEVRPSIATGLLVFETLSAAMTALPDLTRLGLATIELLDAASLRVAQGLSDVPAAIAEIEVRGHAALLVEVHAADAEALVEASAAAQTHFEALPLAVAPRLTTDASERAALWHVRKGLYTAVAVCASLWYDRASGGHRGAGATTSAHLRAPDRAVRRARLRGLGDLRARPRTATSISCSTSVSTIPTASRATGASPTTWSTSCSPSRDPEGRARHRTHHGAVRATPVR